MTCSTTSAPWSNASTPGSRTNLALGSCACAAPSRSNAISCSASSPSPSIKYSACPRCKKLRVDQLAAQVSEKSRASQIMQEALLFSIYRIPFEIDPYAEVGEQPRWVLVKMQKRFRFSVENTEPLLPDISLRSDLLEKIRQ